MCSSLILCSPLIWFTTSALYVRDYALYGLRLVVSGSSTISWFVWSFISWFMAWFISGLRLPRVFSLVIFTSPEINFPLADFPPISSLLSVSSSLVILLSSSPPPHLLFISRDFAPLSFLVSPYPFLQLLYTDVVFPLAHPTVSISIALLIAYYSILIVLSNWLCYSVE
jgi:hypothetical protein